MCLFVGCFVSTVIPDSFTSNCNFIKLCYPSLPNCTKFKSAADVKSQRAKYKGDIHMATSSDLSIQGTKNWRWVGDQLIPNFAFFSWVLGRIVVTFSAHSSSLYVCTSSRREVEDDAHHLLSMNSSWLWWTSIHQQSLAVSCIRSKYPLSHPLHFCS